MRASFDSSMAPRPRPRSPWIAAALALALGACRDQPLGDPPKGALSLVPREATIVGRVDVTRLRGTSMWQRITDERRRDARFGAALDTLARESGWDPLTQLDALTFAAAPTERGDPAAV